MIVFFRLDASSKTGNGHLVRCLSLAKAIANKQFEIVFICADISDAGVRLIESEGFILEKIDSFDNEIVDAEKVKKIITNYPVGIIVADHYQLNISWLKIISSTVIKVVVLDDLINRPFFCHLLINPNCFEAGAYNSLVPDFCELLLGPDFVLIKPEYTKFKKQFENENIKRILIFMGGADSKNVTPKVIEAYSGKEFASIHFDVIIGSGNVNKVLIEDISKQHMNFSTYLDRPHLADLMNLADVSVGGGGNTTWERICVGLPSFIITLADNQVPLTKYLHDLGLTSYIGHYNIITKNRIQEVLLDEISFGQLRKNFKSAPALCDGKGVSRVAQKIQMLAS